NKVMFMLPSALADGNYTLSMPAGTVKDLSNNLQASTWSTPFLILSGDANHDNHVDAADFTLMAQNFGKTAAIYSQGDFNYDGVVNALDFNVVAQKFGISSGASAPPLPQSAPTASLFSNASLDLDVQDFAF